MKKIICILVTFLMLLFFLAAPEAALDASRRGLLLWFHQILPTLLPFSILSYIVLRSNLFAMQPSRFSNSVGNTAEWYIILCGFLFGFPIGSKLTADLYNSGCLSKEKASVLFVFTNNLSPVFVTTVFQEQLGIPPRLDTYVLLYGIPFFFGMIQMRLLRKKTFSSGKQKNTASRFHLDMQIVDAGIINGFETLIKICGYIIMFSLSSELLKRIPILAPTLKTFLIGCTEVTNGMSELSTGTISGNLQYLFAMMFLSWGGISGFFQTASIVSNTDLSMKKYLRVRLVLVGITTLAAGLLCAFRVC